MSNLTTKQKIILGAIIGVMLIIIVIYGYITLNRDGDEFSTEGYESSNLENTAIVNGNTNLNSSENKTNGKSDGENNKDNKTNGGNANDGNELSRANSDNGENNIKGDNDVNGENLNVEEEKINGYENLEGKIVVHITGEILKKGILILPEGARIADAIDKAGGATEQADLDEVNLAYVLEDGQKIYIPSKNDKTKKEGKVYITSESGNNVIVEGKNTSKGENKKVNINIATQTELENLPGIGAAMATRIIEYRKRNGKFNKTEDLKNVKGIGEAKFNNIKEYVTVN